MRRWRKLWVILLGVPLVLLAAETIYWRIAAGRLEQGFAGWVAVRRANGWIEQNAPTRLGGWPLAATLMVPAVSLAGGGPGLAGEIAWSAERLVLRVALTRPGLLEIAPEGRQQLRVSGALDVPYSGDRVRLALPLHTRPWPSFIQAEADNLRADTSAGTATLRSLKLHLDLDPGARAGEPGLAASLHVTEASPPPGIFRPLGPSIANVQADAILSGPLSVRGERLSEAAAGWRDGGGSLEIKHLALSWGPLDLTGSATLALDDQLQPMGAGSARIIGYAETLDALAAHSVISHSAATAAKAVLSLLADAPDDGSRPEVEVPLTLQYRTLSMRQVPLLRLPELDWP
jgi:hypothetical protein